MAKANPRSGKEHHSRLARILPILIWLPNYERAWRRSDIDSQPLVAAGALVEALSRRQAEVKMSFADVFAAFAALATWKMVRSLFGSESKARTRRG